MGDLGLPSQIGGSGKMIYQFIALEEKKIALYNADVSREINSVSLSVVSGNAVPSTVSHINNPPQYVGSWC